MLLLNFKLFFRITVAILSGTTLSGSDNVSTDTMVKSDPIQPAIENVQTEIKNENKLVNYKWDNVSVDSLDVILKNSRNSTEYKKASSDT